MTTAVVLLSLCGVYMMLGMGLVRGACRRAEGARERVWWEGKR